ncbi:hypothetical protein SEPCBS57363_003363 [Sporothrix epigloea]|uniref:Fungal-type protein kinase domain-containing protein n=1 Tax=Sporothrix epigloea TaxID=1892477 RepID=A0ABP0DL27_9PEZI
MRPLEPVNKTGTITFKAIGILQGEQHNFMPGLESFLKSFFWIRIHYDAAVKATRRAALDAWNYKGDQPLIATNIGPSLPQDIL